MSFIGFNQHVTNIDSEQTMIADIQIQETTVTAIREQEPLLIVQDIELLHVGGGCSGTCHF